MRNFIHTRTIADSLRIGRTGLIAAVFTASLLGPHGAVIIDRPEIRLTTTINEPSPGFSLGAGPNGRVRRVVSLPDARLLIAGDFTQVDGKQRPLIARLEPDGQLDASFAQNLSFTSGAFVQGLAVQPDGKIVISGSFTAVNGYARPGLARLKADGTLDVDFVPAVGWDAFSDDGRSLAFAAETSGSVLVVKQAGVLGSVQELARVLSDGQRDQQFVVKVWARSFDVLFVSAVLPLEGDRLLIAGDFSTINGVHQSDVARLFSDGTVDPTFAGNDIVHYFPPLTIAIQADGKVLLGGNTIFKRLFPDGTLDNSLQTQFGPNLSWAADDYELRKILVQPDGKILVGGRFSTVNGQPREAVVRLLPADGQLDPDFVVTFSEKSETFGKYYVDDLILSDDGYLTIAGQFTGLNGSATPNLARIRAVTNAPPSIIVQPVSQTVVEGSSVTFQVVASSLELAYQWFFNGAAIPDATQSKLSLPLVKQANAGAYSVKVSNSLGNIESAPAQLTVTRATPLEILGQPKSVVVTAGQDAVFVVKAQHTLPLTYQWRHNEAPIDRATQSTLKISRAQSSDAGGYSVVVSNPLQSVTSQTAKLTVLPAPTQPGSVDLSFDPGTGPLLDPSPSYGDTNASVLALALQSDGRILIGGQFTRIGRFARPCLARLNSDGSLDSSFDPGGGATDGTRTRIFSGVYSDGTRVGSILLLEGERILVAGDFTKFDGHAVPAVALLKNNGSFDSQFVSQWPSNSRLEIVRSIVRWEDKLYLNTISIDGFTHLESPLVARLFLDGRLDNAFTSPRLRTVSPIYSAYIIDRLAVQGDGSVILWGRFDWINDILQSGLARLNVGGTLDRSFAPSIEVARAGAESLLIAPDGASFVAVVNGQLLHLDYNGATVAQFPLPQGIVRLYGFLNEDKLIAGGPQTIRVLNRDGSRDPDWVETSFDGAISKVAPDSEGRLLVGGSFQHVNGLPMTSLVRLLGLPKPVSPPGLRLSDPKRLANDFSFSLPTESGRTYRLEYKDSLGESQWIPLLKIPGPGGIVPVHDTSAGQTQRFYRVVRE